jgi:hypothetical protein
MSWLIFSISSITDPESFRNAIFYYQKIHRKILRRLHYELIARCYAPLYFVGEQKNAQNLCANGIPVMKEKQNKSEENPNFVDSDYIYNTSSFSYFSMFWKDLQWNKNNDKLQEAHFFPVRKKTHFLREPLAHYKMT